MKYLAGILIPPILCAIVIALCGCSSGSSSDHAPEHYNLSAAKPGELSDVFSEVELTALEFAGNMYPKSVANIQVSNGYVFVISNDHELYVFNSDGSYKSCSFEKIGEGPEEFQIAMGYSWNPYSQLIQVITPFRIMSYDCDFNYVRSVDTPTKLGGPKSHSFLFGEIYDLSSDKHLVCTSGLVGNPYRFINFDSSTGKLGKEIDFNEFVIAPTSMQSRHFFELPDGKILCCPRGLCYKIFNFDKDEDTLTPCISFSAGGKEVTHQYVSDLNMQIEELAPHLLRCDKHILMNSLPTTDRIIAVMKNGDSLRSFYTIFINRITGEMIKVDMFEKDHRNSPLFGDISEGYAYAMLLREQILEMPHILLDKAESADEIMAEIEEDTWVLLKYKFK